MNRKIEEYMLDIDSAGENSREVAYAIKHALGKLKLIDTNFSVILYSQTTDSGGGGNLHSLARELQKLGLPFQSYYLVASCLLHNLQTCSRNGIIDVLGKGGTTKYNDGTVHYKINAMQLLHGAYKIFNYLPYDFMKKIWEDMCQKLSISCPFKIFQKPVLKRWWTVGTAASMLDKDWLVWKGILRTFQTYLANI